MADCGKIIRKKTVYMLVEIEEIAGPRDRQTDRQAA